MVKVLTSQVAEAPGEKTSRHAGHRVLTKSPEVGMETRVCNRCHTAHVIFYRKGESHQFRLPCLGCGKEYETGLKATEVFKIVLVQPTHGSGAPEKPFNPTLKPID